jgi:hypothetical protein
MKMISSNVVAAVKYALPHGLVQTVFRHQAIKRRMLEAKNRKHATALSKTSEYSYKSAIEYHRIRGMTNGHLVAGSIPEASLDYCCNTLDELLPGDRPLLGLHIGNFLGISLAHLTEYARKRNDKSVIMSIDPNIQHQGVENPQNHVISILNYFGLQKNAIISVGYSTNKTVSNDGVTWVGQNGMEYDPYAKFQTEQSCENVLSNLCILSDGRFDFAVVDGNHEGSHLRGEIAVVRRLLRPGGVLILDDVSDAWSEIKAEYDGLKSNGWNPAGSDGRVGILALTNAR